MVFRDRLLSAAFLFAVGAILLALLLGFAPSWAAASGGSGGSSKTNSNSCPPFSTAAPAAESVSGYFSSAPSQLYPNPLPIGDGKLNSAIPDSVKSAWYANMPAPGICENGSFGLCITDDFSNVQGTRVAAITASTTGLVFGAPNPIQATVDAVTSPESNKCGQTATKWSWVLTPAAASQTAYFPTDTNVEVSYSCEPSQTYDWTTSTSCFLGIGKCNVKRHARTFFFASQAQSNIPAVSALYGKTDFVPQAGSSYTLACGGYRPESGSATPPLYGQSSKNGGVCFLGIDCGSGNDFGYYNVSDPSYWQPGITLSVNVCGDPDDIVVNNVCTPCSTVKPGSHRVDNVCVLSTPALTITALVNGAPVSSVPVGTKVTVQATYSNDKSDPLTKTDITGGAGGATSSVCSSGRCSTAYNSQKSFATTTYTFTPSATGTYTFYPQAQTKTLNALQNYGNVSKTLTVTAPCPGNAKQSGNTCTCNDNYFVYIGGSCVLTCPATMQANQGGTTCIAKLPTSASITFSASRIRSGQSSTLSWIIPGMMNGITCDIAPHAGLTTLMPAWSGNASWSGSITTTPLTEPAQYTLSCANGEQTVSKDVVVQIVPQYQEI